MSQVDTTNADGPQDGNDDQELFERLRDRYEGEDEEVVRICDLVVQSESESSREVAN